MKRLFVATACLGLPCFIYAKASLAITAYTYFAPHVVFDKKKTEQFFWLDVAASAIDSFLGDGSYGKDGTMTTAAMEFVPKSDGMIYVNGVKKGSSSSSGPLVVSVPAGNHNVEVCYDYDDKGHYLICGKKSTYVGDGTQATVAVYADELYLTEKGKIAKAEAEARAAEEKRRKEIEDAERKRQMEIRRAEEQRLAEIKRAEEEKRKEEERKKYIALKEQGLSGNFKIYQSNFTRDGKLNVVTDNISGLMWEDMETSSEELTWKEAKKYCDKLELAGFDDWRMPTIKELQSTMDNALLGSKYTLNSVFEYQETKNPAHWSSTVGAKVSTTAWIADFKTGVTGWGDMRERHPVRCVREIER